MAQSITSPTTEDTLDERQSDLDEALQAARDLVAALETAESCETGEDFDANLLEALDGAATVRSEVRRLTS